MGRTLIGQLKPEIAKSQIGLAARRLPVQFEILQFRV